MYVIVCGHAVLSKVSPIRYVATTFKQNVITFQILTFYMVIRLVITELFTKLICWSLVGGRSPCSASSVRYTYTYVYSQTQA